MRQVYNQRSSYSASYVAYLLSTLMVPTALMAGERPNIILFLVDDLGWQDTSLPLAGYKTEANEHYRTPHLESLAERGVAFSSAYASSVSSPSRCSILTGSHAARHRVTNWTLHRDTPTDTPDDLLKSPQWNWNGIAPYAGINETYVATTFVELLKQVGYRTIHVGKAHWGATETPGENPLNLGFDINVAGHAGGGLSSYYGQERYGYDASGQATSAMAIPGLERYWDSDIFATEALTLEALKSLEETIERDPKQPFFLHMSHYAVHVPFNKDPRFAQHYKDLPPNEQSYATLVEGVDKSLGDIMQWLEKRGLSEKTIIIFASDNGGLSASSYWRSGALHKHNAPLKSGKGSLHEGGVRIPLVIRHPTLGQEGSINDSPIILEDLFPSILEFASVENWEVPQVVDGVSLGGVLRGKKMRKRTLYWNYPHKWGLTGPGIDFVCSFREGDYKLIYHYDTGEKELYNLRSDLSEEHNLVKLEPRRTRRMSKKLGDRLRSVGAQRPSFAKTNTPCPWPDEVD